MEKYILTKTQKGKKDLYEVKDEKGTHGVPNGYISCEGRCCQEAYEMYIEEWTE